MIHWVLRKEDLYCFHWWHMFNFFALALLPDGVGPCSLENAQQKSEIDGDTVFTQKCDTLLNAFLATDKILDCETVKHPKGLKSFQEKKWSGQLEENGCAGDFRKSIVGFSAPPPPPPTAPGQVLVSCPVHCPAFLLLEPTLHIFASLCLTNTGSCLHDSKRSNISHQRGAGLMLKRWPMSKPAYSDAVSVIVRLALF